MLRSQPQRALTDVVAISLAHRVWATGSAGPRELAATLMLFASERAQDAREILDEVGKQGAHRQKPTALKARADSQGSEPNSGHGDHSRLSCGVCDTQFGAGFCRELHGRWPSCGVAEKARIDGRDLFRSEDTPSAA